MAKIKPFRGYRYNSDKIGGLDTVVSPPYYNMSDADKEAFYALSEYNSVRLFSGKRYDEDAEENSAFTRAKTYLDEWIADGILVRDEEPVIYMYEQTVSIGGTLYSNTSFVALVELEDDGMVMPCEKPHEVSLNDRYELLAATNADISMINCLYMERERDLYNLMNELREEPADVEFSSGDTPDETVQQRLWKISYKPTIDFIVESFKNISLYITDGQTRYEACLKYRDYMKANNPNHTGDEPYNYMMMSLSNSNSDGLVSLPVHREVKTPRSFSEAHFIAGAQDHFKVEKIIVDSSEDSLVSTMVKQISTVKAETRIAAYCGGDYFYRMILSDSGYIKNEVYPEMSKEYCELDIVALNKLILEDVFRIKEDTYQEYVNPTRSYKACYRNVQEGKRDIMFVLNPVRVEQIKNITAAGERLPEMTVSVYPKPSVGIIINIKED